MQDERPVDRVLTFGEKAVGITFNPSKDDKVTDIKNMYAMIIDYLHNLRGPNSDNQIQNEINRLLSIAITESQSAQMWAVKAAT